MAGLRKKNSQMAIHTSTIDGYVNRTVDITAAATLSVVCYNSCDACDGSGGGDNGGGTDPTTTTFNVDMSCATEAGATLNGATEITEVFVMDLGVAGVRRTATTC